MYVSFREKFLTKADQVQAEGNKQSSAELFQTAILDYLNNAQSVEKKLKGVDLSKITLVQALDSHVVITVGE